MTLRRYQSNSKSPSFLKGKMAILYKAKEWAMQMLYSSINLFQESQFGDPALNLDLIDDDDEPYQDHSALTDVNDYDSPTSTDSDEETAEFT